MIYTLMKNYIQNMMNENDTIIVGHKKNKMKNKQKYKRIKKMKKNSKYKNNSR